MPTRAEVAAFESDTFDIDGWIDQRLQGDAYATRVRQVYMDLMRLEVNSSFRFVPGTTTLRRKTVTGPDGKDLHVYFREGQRRTRLETDGTFCLTLAETGMQFPSNRDGEVPVGGTKKTVTTAILNAYTVAVRPWWLYSDYKSATPKDRYNEVEWAEKYPGFVPAPELTGTVDAPIETIRVCKEEAQTAATGTVFTTGYKKPAGATEPPYGRLSYPPSDSNYAIANDGQKISCTSSTALSNSADCGCGVGLERCMPGGSAGNDPVAFLLPQNAPLGLDAAFDRPKLAQSWWTRIWWTEEATHFLDDILKEDRDFREVLTSKGTVVNGPLAQWYRATASATCCGKDPLSFNWKTPGTSDIKLRDYYPEPIPLFDPANVPADLTPHDTSTWKRVEDRGPLASGLLTMPIFLAKYGSRRARAHVLYNTFLCREFVSENAELKPDTNPDLRSRSGCADCHATLEPLASYFTRIVESDWTYLPPEHFPLRSETCKMGTDGKIKFSSCSKYYDPAFATEAGGQLRGGYGSEENAEAGPQALAEKLVATNEFATCAARNVATSFLGRPLSADDTALQEQLADELVLNGYSMRALVRALVRSDAYRKANNLGSTVWREEGDQ